MISNKTFSIRKIGDKCQNRGFILGYAVESLSQGGYVCDRVKNVQH